MMTVLKRQLAGAFAALLITAGAAAGQSEPAEAGERLAALLEQLAEPDRADAGRIESEIVRLWSRSGSPAMDLLLQRGQDAMEDEDHALAVEHLTALTDHAPGFAEGWNARATAFFLMGEYGLSIADIERTLALNPHHFGALGGLAIMLEQMGETEMALRALREAHEIHPNREDFTDGIARLSRITGEADL